MLFKITALLLSMGPEALGFIHRVLTLLKAMPADDQKETAEALFRVAERRALVLGLDEALKKARP